MVSNQKLGLYAFQWVILPVEQLIKIIQGLIRARVVIKLQ